MNIVKKNPLSIISVKREELDMTVFVQCDHELTAWIESLGCRGKGGMAFFRIKKRKLRKYLEKKCSEYTVEENIKQ